MTCCSAWSTIGGPFDRPGNMADATPTRTTSPRKEVLLLLKLLFIGILVLPALIYLVGDAIFGEYGGSGFGAFYGALLGHLAI